MQLGQEEGEVNPHLVLDEVLPLIHRTLVFYYRLMDEEAHAFEEVLSVWFQRLTRRTGNRMSDRELRQQLLFVSCKYARAFQIARFRGLETAQTELTLALARPPEDVAIELSSEFRHSREIQ